MEKRKHSNFSRLSSSLYAYLVPPFRHLFLLRLRLHRYCTRYQDVDVFAFFFFFSVLFGTRVIKVFFFLGVAMVFE